jgi:N-acetylneuraminic acid mutarotase
VKSPTLLLIVIYLLGCLASAQELVWKDMAELPQPVAGYAAAAKDSKLLIIGGSYWKDEKKYWVDLVQSFDPRTNSWHNETPLPAPRSDAAFAVLGDGIYVFGGGAHDEITTDALVLRGGKWKTVPGADLPEPRRYPVTVAADGFIYLLGGMSKHADYTTVTNTFWRWRPGYKKWETLSPLPGPGRINHAMVKLGGNICVLGGATTKGRDDVESLKDVYKYDLARQSWTRLPDLAIANHAWWTVGLGERALLVGGYIKTFAADVAIYDPQKNELQPLAPLPRGVADLKCVLLGDLVIFAGGEVGDHIRGKWTTAAQLPASWLRKPGH